MQRAPLRQLQARLSSELARAGDHLHAWSDRLAAQPTTSRGPGDDGGSGEPASAAAPVPVSAASTGRRAPEHWLDVVRAHAPDLLEGGGIRMTTGPIAPPSPGPAEQRDHAPRATGSDARPLETGPAPSPSDGPSRDRSDQHPSPRRGLDDGADRATPGRARQAPPSAPGAGATSDGRPPRLVDRARRALAVAIAPPDAADRPPRTGGSRLDDSARTHRSNTDVSTAATARTATAGAPGRDALTPADTGAATARPPRGARRQPSTARADRSDLGQPGDDRAATGRPVAPARARTTRVAPAPAVEPTTSAASGTAPPAAPGRRPGETAPAAPVDPREPSLDRAASTGGSAGRSMPVARPPIVDPRAADPIDVPTDRWPSLPAGSADPRSRDHPGRRRHDLVVDDRWPALPDEDDRWFVDPSGPSDPDRAGSRWPAPVGVGVRASAAGRDHASDLDAEQRGR